ncbi:hypothetical protein GCM10022232_68950 [Streptomyces plumbiresistens]|uniref:Uncharacterized protein n=1 Tax=Streptomyces plumbiresistens TaxID=511811 RepID=A0ABP7SSW7_9ACTN
MLDDVLVPRPGNVDPQTCPACARIRAAISACVRTGNAVGAREVVLTMRAHMIHGHPDDPRNVLAPAR